MPAGVLLYTPGPYAPANHTPAFDVGFALALAAVLTLASLISFFAALTMLVLRLLTADTPMAWSGIKTVMLHSAVIATVALLGITCILAVSTH